MLSPVWQLIYQHPLFDLLRSTALETAINSVVEADLQQLPLPLAVTYAPSARRKQMFLQLDQSFS